MKKTIIIAIMLALVGAGMVFSLSADKNGNVERVKGYDFPLKPGMVEWGNLKNVTEKYEATQIPAEILVKMSTEELIETCQNYPLLVNLFLFNSLEAGFEQLKQNFNGFRELISRKDAGEKLLKKYCAFNPSDLYEKIRQKSPGATLFPVVILEVFLSQDEIIQTLSSKKRYLLAGIALEKFEVKQQYPEIYGYLSLSPNGAVMKSVLKVERFFNLTESEEVKSSYMGVDLQNIDRIVEQTKKYLVQKTQ